MHTGTELIRRVSELDGGVWDISDDKLILPKWIEAAQKRSVERSRRPVLSLDIARFGEDETCRHASRGRWIRLHRAQHKADTMTTGHIAKAYRDIREERG
jgi:hypothetical protein